MNNTDYSIDEVKLITKVKRYKRRWKEQRHYSEYLKRKLAKKALQVRKLKAKSANWRDTAIQLSANCGAAGSEIDSLKARAENAEQMVEQLVNAIEAGANIELFPRADLLRFREWYAKMEAIIAEWKEAQK